MAKTLKQILLDGYNIDITHSHIRQLETYCNEFEIRDHHVEALNTPMLGVAKAYFTNKDRVALFNIFEVDPLEFETAILECPTVKKEYKVSSDEYNVFTIWLLHLIHRSKTLSDKDRELGMLLVMKMLHYKFFTSLVNHNFPHGANAEIMAATIDNLSAKFDIKQEATSTWKLVVEERSRDVISKDSIHWETIDRFGDDNKILYVITDIQTRIRTRIVLVVQQYYTQREKGIRIASSNMVNEIDGEKIIRSLEGSYDAMIETLCNQVINTSKFMKHDYIAFVSKLSLLVREDMLRDLLVKFSELATEQYRNHDQNKVSSAKTGELYIGYRILITNIIQKTYRACITDKSVNVRSKLAILDKTRTIYRSSRIADPDILKIKASVEAFVQTHSGYTRDATVAALRLALIQYLIMLSFDQ
jgi:hypothetical protein